MAYKTEHELAQENAKEIAEFLLQNYPGKIIDKSALRARFLLPLNRAGLVWQYLHTYGIRTEMRKIIVPKKE